MAPHIRELLHAQAIAARNFTCRLYDAPLDGLATVYVRQQVRSAPTTGTAVEVREEFRKHERNRPDAERHRRQFVPMESAVQPVAPARAAEETLGLHRHVLITGGAGQGKSTLSLQLAASPAAAYATGSTRATDATRATDTATDPTGAARTVRPERLLPLRVTAGRLAADRSALVRLLRILSAETTCRPRPTRTRACGSRPSAPWPGAAPSTSRRRPRPCVPPPVRLRRTSWPGSTPRRESRPWVPNTPISRPGRCARFSATRTAGPAGTTDTYARRAVERIVRDFGQGYAP
ncbi:hypothetical protein [Embleya sp. NPDC059259]|uniref:hypothetical protein n=1 Tax=unclassified Embleya TaxID=2699296 RepID=UPI003696D914